MNVAKIRQLAFPPTSLGGAHPTGFDRVAESESYYCNLERLDKLPLIRRSDSIEDENTKQIYQQLCAGDFSPLFGAPPTLNLNCQ